MAILITVSQWSIPLIILTILGIGWYKKIALYEVFIQGATAGLKTTIRLTPYLLAIFVAIGLFRISGALDLLLWLFTPILHLIGLPNELITLGILKPLSGSASLGITAELLNKYGPDSAIGLIASLIQGSSETTFYIFSVYLGSVGIKNGRHILTMGLIGELVTLILAICIGNLLVKMVI